MLRALLQSHSLDFAARNRRRCQVRICRVLNWMIRAVASLFGDFRNAIYVRPVAPDHARYLNLIHHFHPATRSRLCNTATNA